MNPLPRKIGAALLAALGFALPPADLHAQETRTLLAESFTGASSLPAGWRCLNSSAAGTANTVVADDTSPLAGGVARFAGSSSNNALLINFPAVRLSQAGHFVEARFDFRYLSSPTQGNANSGPLVGLYDSAGTWLSAHAFGVANATGDDLGYKATKLALSSSGDLRLLSEQRTASTTAFSSYTGASLASASSGLLANTGAPHQGRLRIELAANQSDLVVTFAYDGQTLVHTVPGASVLTRSFDQLVLMGAGGLGGGVTHVDNVSVTASAWRRVLGYGFESSAELSGWSVQVPGAGAQPADNAWLAVTRQPETAVPVAEGTYCARLQVKSPAPSTAGHRSWTSPAHPIGPRASDRLRLRLRVRSIGLAGGDLALAVVEQAAGGTELAAEEAIRFVPTGGWLSVDQIVEIRPDTAALRVRILVKDNALASGQLFLDGLSVDHEPDEGTYLLNTYSGYRGNVIAAGGGGRLLLDFADRRATQDVAVTVFDERGPLNPQPAVSLAGGVATVDLPGRGFYRVRASGEVIDPRRGALPFVREVSAAVVPAGPPATESAFGTFAVASSNPLAARGGGRWNRFFILSQAVTAHADGVTFSSGRQGHAESQYIAVPDFPHLPADQRWIACLINVPQSMAKVPAGRTWSQSHFYAPTNWAQFKAFLKYILVRLPASVEHFELINEPEYNWHGSLADLNRYFKTAREALDELKAQGQATRLKLIGPAFARFYSPQYPYASGSAGLPFTDHAVSPIGSKFIIQDRLFRGGLFSGDTGLLSYVDEIAMHGYVNASRPEEEFYPMIEAFRNYAAQFGPVKPIHLTEFGWQTGESSWQAPVPELTRAAYTSRALILARSFEMRSILFFSLKFVSGGALTGYSALELDDTPMPTYVAWAAANRALEDAASLQHYGALDSAGQIRAARFANRDGSTTLCLWSLTDGLAVRLSTTSGLTITDYLGRPRTPPADRRLVLNGEPLFLHSPNAFASPTPIAGTITAEPGATLDVLEPVNSVVADEAFAFDPDTRRLSAPATAGLYQLLVETAAGWDAFAVDLRGGAAVADGKALAIEREENGWRLGFSAEPGWTHQLQRAEALGAVTLWRNLGAPLAGATTRLAWHDSSSPGRAFYRVVLER